MPAITATKQNKHLVTSNLIANSSIKQNVRIIDDRATANLYSYSACMSTELKSM